MREYFTKIANERYEAEKKFECFKKSIRNCPFCGSTADIFNVGYGSGNYGSCSHLVIRCSNSDCDVSMVGPDTSWQDINSYIDKVPIFIKKWNNRV